MTANSRSRSKGAVEIGCHMLAGYSPGPSTALIQIMTDEFSRLACGNFKNVIYRMSSLDPITPLDRREIQGAIEDRN